MTRARRTLRGGMMAYPLTLGHFIERAGTLFADKPVLSVEESGVERSTWGRVRSGSRALAAALADLGIEPGQRVATLAWNHRRHLEAYFGVPCSGAVLHTINVRLSAGQIAGILRHGGARVVLADPEFVDLLDAVAPSVPALRMRVVMGGEAPPGWSAYDALVARHAYDSAGYRWPELDEEAAAGLCYTSGTTGQPKGVLYSHRALALHAMAIALPDGFGLAEADVILPAVPMFHANAWGLPHVAAMVGATLVLPGARPSPELIVDLLEAHAVTFAAGVPTVWLGVLDALRPRRARLAPRLRIHSGGAPSPPALIEAFRRRGVEVLTGWGMTELSPVGMVTHPRGHLSTLPPGELLALRTSQGTPLPFVEARVVDESGSPVPHDGASPGELEVRGPWVIRRYFRSRDASAFHDGWLRTGDIATVDGLGYVRLVDRTKDLIRSGGEWISSVQLEHALMDHPAVSEAAVVAVPNPKWQERPVACVVLRPGSGADAGELLRALEGRFPRWWIPDRVVFLDALPRTGTGKFDKRELRARLGAAASTPANRRPHSS